MHEKTAREEVIAEATSAIDVNVMLRSVMERDPRYRFGAYMWLLAEGLEYVMKQHLGLTEETRRHMTGSEIVWGLRALALEQFGPLARDVWQHWGIRSTRDWGEIVFNLIGSGLLDKNEEDCVEDFADVFDMDTELNS